MSERDATAKRTQNVRNAPVTNNRSKIKKVQNTHIDLARCGPNRFPPNRQPPGGPHRAVRCKVVRAAHAQNAQAHLRTHAPPAARRADRPRARG